MFLCSFPFTPGFGIPYDAVVKRAPVAIREQWRAVKRNTKRNNGRISFSKKGAIWQQQK
jgi:hypothetical protein